MVGNASLWDTRRLRDVTVPDGVEAVGDFWFAHAEIESVTISASVKELGEKAFYHCDLLRRVTIASGSELRRIGRGCF